MTPADPHGEAGLLAYLALRGVGRVLPRPAEATRDVPRTAPRLVRAAHQHQLSSPGDERARARLRVEPVAGVAGAAGDGRRGRKRRGALGTEPRQGHGVEPPRVCPQLYAAAPRAQGASGRRPGGPPEGQAPLDGARPPAVALRLAMPDPRRFGASASRRPEDEHRSRASASTRSRAAARARVPTPRARLARPQIQASAIEASQIATIHSVAQKKNDALSRWIWAARRKGRAGSRIRAGSSGMSRCVSSVTRRATATSRATLEPPKASARQGWPLVHWPRPGKTRPERGRTGTPSVIRAHSYLFRAGPIMARLPTLPVTIDRGPRPYQTVSPEEAERLLALGAVVLDVRTPREHEELGHIPGALLLPVELAAVAPAVVPDDGRPVVVVCEHGVRSRQAAALLAEAGVAACNMAGGMSRWTGPRVHEPSPISGPSPWLLSNAHLAPRGARTLDVACGRGRHALLLAGAGFPVRAVDRDAGQVAWLNALARRLQLPLDAEVVDLESAAADLGEEEWELVLVFNYLHRPLVPRARPRAEAGRDPALRDLHDGAGEARPADEPRSPPRAGRAAAARGPARGAASARGRDRRALARVRGGPQAAVPTLAQHGDEPDGGHGQRRRRAAEPQAPGQEGGLAFEGSGERGRRGRGRGRSRRARRSPPRRGAPRVVRRESPAAGHSRPKGTAHSRYCALCRP